MASSDWPKLDYKAWKDTFKTLHLWTQVVGKIRMCHEPWANHSWYSTLYLTPRGLGTTATTNGEGLFSIEFDLLRHWLIILTSNGGEMALPLHSESVAGFYERVLHACHRLGIESKFSPLPNEVADATPFDKDHSPRVYDHEKASNFFHVMCPINNILKEFRALYVGKCSPVHFFWGSFDLALTRFSGRRAPDHPGGIPHLPDRVAREAYSHEVSSCGFWPGNDIYPYPAFYSYAYPEPDGFSLASAKPATAMYHPQLREFLLPYDDVRTSKNPRKAILEFCQSTYEAAADLGRWDRHLLEDSPYRESCERKGVSKVDVPHKSPPVFT